MFYYRIISLVTPLLRRMVTNERQRQYAIEARASKNTPSEGVEVVNRQTKDQAEKPSRDPPRTLSGIQKPREPSSQYAEIDPKLDNYHYSLDPTFHTPDGNPALATPKPQHANGEFTNQEILEDTIEAQANSTLLHYHVNVLSNGTRLRPKLTLTPGSCPGFPSLVQHIHNVMSDDDQHHLSNIQVLGVNGLVNIDGDEAWIAAVKSVQENDWMDGDVKVVVEVGYLQDGGSE